MDTKSAKVLAFLALFVAPTAFVFRLKSASNLVARSVSFAKAVLLK
jgi:hypothetical protein